MSSLRNKTLFVTGASRGIGKAIALRAAKDGANVLIAAKTVKESDKLSGTIFSAADEIIAAGGNALPLEVDVRDENSIHKAVEEAVASFGGIDIVVNNASAISLTDTSNTPMKRFDLIMSVNVRATYAVTQACLPYLRKAENPHILSLSPPPSLHPKWYAKHVAYTISKMGMSLCVLGWAEEFRQEGIAANALWPLTVIDTAAVRMLGGEIKPEFCRTADIVADAAHSILTRPARECTGNFFIDEDVLRQDGISDFAKYAVDPTKQLVNDIFVSDLGGK